MTSGSKKLGRLRFKRIQADRPIDIYEALVAARRLQLQPALARAVSEVGVAVIDEELKKLVPSGALNHVAGLGLRGERVFPVPSILEHAPPLIGYYRMLLGISKKEFQQTNKLGYGPWLGAEERAVMSPDLVSALPRFCTALIEPLVKVVYAMDTFDNQDLSDLALLTLGPTLQGGRNNVIGSRASRAVFESLRALVADRTTFDSERLVRFMSPSGQAFVLIEGSDPDVRLDAVAPNGEETPVVAMEIKGGKDASNAHNRAGEAEKSHIKARIAGYGHRWTIMVVRGLYRERLQEETPSSTELFDASQIMGRSGPDWKTLLERFSEIIGELQR